MKKGLFLMPLVLFTLVGCNGNGNELQNSVSINSISIVPEGDEPLGVNVSPGSISAGYSGYVTLYLGDKASCGGITVDNLGLSEKPLLGFLTLENHSVQKISSVLHFEFISNGNGQLINHIECALFDTDKEKGNIDFTSYGKYENEPVFKSSFNQMKFDYYPIFENYSKSYAIFVYFVFNDDVVESSYYDDTLQLDITWAAVQ